MSDICPVSFAAAAGILPSQAPGAVDRAGVKTARQIDQAGFPAPSLRPGRGPDSAEIAASLLFSRSRSAGN